MKAHYLFPIVFLLAWSGYAQTPCKCCSATQQAFSFWIGDWEVSDSTGKVLGTNHITSSQDSCLMEEHWASAVSSYTGSSYNFYDSQSKQWRQLWIDNQGGHLDLAGGLENGSMVMTSPPAQDQAGKTYINRITWTPLPDGRVRQNWETSYDNGATWTSVFDGYYTRKPAAER